MNLSPLPIQKFFSNSGQPLAGGLLFTYTAGTSTKVATYIDSSGGTPNTNPIVLDFRGECRLWIDPTLSYKFVLSPSSDTDPPTSPIWSVDDITASPAQLDNSAIDTGSVNNIELSIQQISAPVAFTRVIFKAANTNTGATTLTINGGTSKAVTWQTIEALSGGEIQQGGLYEVIFDGLQWQLAGPPILQRTAVETAAGVFPVDYSKQPGDARRYGALGSSDDTTYLRDWLLACEGAPYHGYLPAATSASKYITDPLTIPSNVTLVFDRGAIIEARTGYGLTDVLLDFDGASNVTMECNGALFRMLKSEYVSGEHRHCFNLVNCTDILIKDPVEKDSGGDGYYMNGFTRLTLINSWAENNRRNNYSMIGGTTFRGVGEQVAKAADGTAPEAGWDFEPNSDADELVDIVIDTIVAEGNSSHAVSVFLDDYKTGTPPDVSISIGRIVSRNNGGNAFRVRNVFLDSGSYGGFINVGEVISDGDAKAAVYIEDKALAGPLITVGSVTTVNPCTGASSFADTAAVYIADTSATVSGGIHINHVSAKATHTDMDYGVIMEMGQGYTDVRIGIDNVVGFQVAPVRYNNISSSVADATDALIDTSKLTGTVALTASTSIVATTYIGRVITNAGATGNIAHTLNGYPPPGNPYVFRIDAAHDVTIDVASASDRILGTTVGGADIKSSVVGEGVEVSYVGTIGAVRYWRANILGAVSNWTFS